MKRPEHGPDLAILQNDVSELASSQGADIDHRPGQVVCPNYLVREQHPKHGRRSLVGGDSDILQRYIRPDLGDIVLAPTSSGRSAPETVNSGNETWCVGC